MRSTIAAALMSALMGLAPSGCGKDGGGSNDDDGEDGAASVADYIAAVTTSDGSGSAQLRSGTRPTATSSASITADLAAATGTTTLLRGGTSSLPVSAGATRVVIAIEGIAGYWELTGLSPGAAQTVLVTFAQDAAESFTVQLAAGDASGLGAYQEVPVELTDVGTGDVQVNVTWDLDVDVDLHVLDPDGDEIYYGAESSASGGTLDLDSNAGCSLDHVKAENVTWPEGTAPSGTYKVVLDYYEACSAGTVKYAVTVNVKDQAPQIFNGSFTQADEDFGDECFTSGSNTLACGRMITSFTVR